MKNFLRLVAAGEPFRLLFPVGTLIGLTGVLLWPLHFYGWMTDYPGVMHARIMIEGFFASFIVGFLGTAFPRLLKIPGLTLWESIGFAAALVSITWLHLDGQTFMGDQIFFIVIGYLVLALGVRSILRKDVPPPAFVLVALGIACALAGVATQVIPQVMPNALSAWAAPVGRLLLYQGFVLLPVMGVGAFLLPRFFGLPNRQDFPATMALPVGWGRSALFALACGSVVIAGLVVEAFGHVRWGCALKATAVLVYFFREVPWHRAGSGGGTLVTGLRIALLSVPLGYMLMAVWPAQALSLLHVVFITGFGLLTLVVASRVVLGHSGQSQRFQSRLWPVWGMIVLVVFAMLTRVTADWMPDVRMSHYAYAGLAWAAGVVVWAVTILPGVVREDLED